MFWCAQRILIKISNVYRMWLLMETCWIAVYRKLPLKVTSFLLYLLFLPLIDRWTFWTSRCLRAIGQQLSSLLLTSGDHLSPSRSDTIITCSHPAGILLIHRQSSTKRPEFIKEVEPCGLFKHQKCSIWKVNNRWINNIASSFPSLGISCPVL